MPSHRRIPGLQSNARAPKARTPLQQQLLDLQEKDDRHAEASHAARLRRFTANPILPQVEDPPDLPIPAHIMDEWQADDAEPGEVDAGEDEIDLNQFMPFRFPTGPSNDEVNPVLEALRREQHLSNRRKHEDRWAWQYALMLPTFLRCRLATSNWGDEARWNHDFRPPCNCARRTERDVDLIDILTSPSQPRTAFSVRLMKHHHAVWLRFAVGTQGFCDALDDTLDDHSPLILTSKMQPRDWRQPFTEAIDAYRAIIMQIRKIEHERLRLSKLGILAVNCPKCFGPPVGTTQTDEARVVVCLDVQFLIADTKKYQAELLSSEESLAKLLQANESHTYEYFEAQWGCQRELQLKEMNVRTKEKRVRLEVLIELEEELLEARKRMNEIDAGNAAIRTAEQRQELLGLPRSLANLEVKMQEVAQELGNAEVVNVRHGTDARVKGALAVQVAMGFLYEAKWDVMQQQSNAAIRTGVFCP
ncbi:uncharacterized protein MELLADRAFT_113453 [Melampsora larici-populina 98AG31]|uniref:CxC1-like cysteine cluster associated with KDZ transposases domain-containing protein n=1 Tax=Melampsora larici-populina (strain 98AG31 / pathotype 3-4-7) TaxID=747676 RepID=F4S9X1_MELLP|nr:uncharacterized protein MELLADRAFT_113453 [Melampsora larici-populina 98AG31]EGF98558.1 hypothetical protein MELLADRAFT_113453 [Melampsora larici-populina 98AG31]